MVQDRLKSLLVLMIERKILLSLNKDEIVNEFAKTSLHLTKALIETTTVHCFQLH